MKPRYIVTRVKKDRTVPARYQRSGWMAFDTTHKAHGQVWALKALAIAEAQRLNRCTCDRWLGIHRLDCGVWS